MDQKNNNDFLESIEELDNLKKPSDSMEVKPKKSLGYKVTHIALFLGSLGGFIFGLFMFLAGWFLMIMAGGIFWLFVLFISLGIIIMAASISNILVAVGVLKYKNWPRLIFISIILIIVLYIMQKPILLFFFTL